MLLEGPVEVRPNVTNVHLEDFKTEGYSYTYSYSYSLCVPQNRYFFQLCGCIAYNYCIPKLHQPTIPKLHQSRRIVSTISIIYCNQVSWLH